MNCPDCNTFTCEVCGKQLPANMMYEYENMDVCWICLTALQDQAEVDRMNDVLDFKQERMM